MYISPNIPLKTSKEIAGTQQDFKILEEDQWLINTEVRYQLQKRKGLWDLTMLYVAIDNPLKFICRTIDSYNSEKKALTFAKILQRGIRKDARGTLKIYNNAFNICSN